jgi:hypothetical protein
VLVWLTCMYTLCIPGQRHERVCICLREFQQLSAYNDHARTCTYVGFALLHSPIITLARRLRVIAALRSRNPQAFAFPLLHVCFPHYALLYISLSCAHVYHVPPSRLFLAAAREQRQNGLPHQGVIAAGTKCINIALCIWHTQAHTHTNLHTYTHW